MIYHIDDIVKDVRIAIDENANSDILANIGDMDTLTINEIIKSKIIEGVNLIHSKAPAYLLDGGYNFGESVYWKEDNSGWIILPEDFMRLVAFQMSDWDYPVYSAIFPDSPEYIKQHSRFVGIKGNRHRPVCAITIRPDGRTLEFYSCKDNNATVTKGIYLPYSSIDEMNGITICERCYKASVYTIASLTWITLGDNDKSKILSDLSDNLLQS